MTDRLTNDDLIEHIRTALGGVGPQQTRRIMKVAGFLLDRLNAAEARVAKLEAKVAAQQWRPVEEIPANTDVELRVVGGFRSDGYWYYHGPEKIRGWQPISPAPQEPTP